MPDQPDPEKPRKRPDLKQGNRGSGGASKPQLTREQLAHMTPEAINAARLAGQCDEILGIKR